MILGFRDESLCHNLLCWNEKPRRGKESFEKKSSWKTLGQEERTWNKVMWLYLSSPFFFLICFLSLYFTTLLYLSSIRFYSFLSLNSSSFAVGSCFYYLFFFTPINTIYRSSVITFTLPSQSFILIMQNNPDGSTCFPFLLRDQCLLRSRLQF